jgi:hypothetical protein
MYATPEKRKLTLYPRFAFDTWVFPYYSITPPGRKTDLPIGCLVIGTEEFAKRCNTTRTTLRRPFEFMDAAG